MGGLEILNTQNAVHLLGCHMHLDNICGRGWGDFIIAYIWGTRIGSVPTPGRGRNQKGFIKLK